VAVEAAFEGLLDAAVDVAPAIAPAAALPFSTSGRFIIPFDCSSLTVIISGLPPLK
jgi:hypothetical protein